MARGVHYVPATRGTEPRNRTPRPRPRPRLETQYTFVSARLDQKISYCTFEACTTTYCHKAGVLQSPCSTYLPYTRCLIRCCLCISTHYCPHSCSYQMNFRPIRMGGCHALFVLEAAGQLQARQRGRSTGGVHGRPTHFPGIAR
jgi:hypothetical protein